MACKNLSSFIDSCVGYESITMLPITHITDCNLFEKIIDDSKLSVYTCNVFNKDLLYFYYGRPSYSPDGKVQANRHDNQYCPVCIIFDYTDKNLFKIYPFDSGAFNLEKVGYRNYIHAKEKLDTYELGNTIEAIQKYIKTFFGDNERYVNGEHLALNDEKLPEHIKSLVNMFSANGDINLDDRAKTIEISYLKDFPLDKAKAIILPEALKTKDEINEFFEKNKHIKCYTYKTRSAYFPKRYYETVVVHFENYLKGGF